MADKISDALFAAKAARDYFISASKAYDKARAEYDRLFDLVRKREGEWRDACATLSGILEEDG